MRFYKKSWHKILILGIILFIITEKIMIYTKNIMFLPTVIVLGSFLIPVVFITFIYEKSPKKPIPFKLFAYCFLVGGLLGILSAGILEYEVFRTLGFLPLLWVGIAEEAAKLIFPLAIYLTNKYKHKFDGITLGVASGMGFAAMETMGYALVNLIEHGNINSLLDILLIRGLISPFGHAAWTGYLCFVLWQSNPRFNRIFKTDFIKAFLLVVFLHTLWNTSQSINLYNFRFFGLNIIGLFVAFISFFLLIKGLTKSYNDKKIII